MEFTPQETKYIEKIRKHNRQVIKFRWWSLGTGVAMILMCGCWGYYLHRLTEFSGESKLDAMSVLVLALFWTKCCIWLVLGTWRIVKTCVNWNGDMDRMLLLKLLDAQERKN